jgi:hypothetical protein
MPVWPKIVYTYSASLKTAAMKLKLREQGAAAAQQADALGALTPQLAATSYWKEAGVESGMSYPAFQTRVPLNTHERIAPAIERMQRGESDVLWPGHCALFGLTSGTSTGIPRSLPMTDALLAHLRRAGFEALLYYTARAKHGDAFHGRHFFYGSTTALRPLNGDSPSAGRAGEVSGIVALNFPEWAQRHFYEPGESITRIDSWDAQIEAIAARTQSRDITLLSGVPNGVVQLAEALKLKFGARTNASASLQDQWPNLECFVHSGASITPYAAELRKLLGPNVAFHEIYAASECFLAVQDSEPSQGLRLLTDAGVFFEFIALDDFNAEQAHQPGAKAVPVEGVKKGVDYVVLVTTPGGLARYVLGDVVRFTSVAPPRLIHVGGIQIRLNAFGENVTEKDLVDTLAGLCQRRDWSLVNFHVAPLFSGRETLRHQEYGSHEWWVELKPGTTITPTGPQMAAELDAELRRANPTYNLKRMAGVVHAPTVRLVMPGVFEHWLRFHGKWGGQHKMPRCRSDRLVADEFARVTNFARD